MNITTLLKQISFLVIFLILSWVLVHFLALFGIFLALALPLLHLAFYPHIMCFWCKLKGGTHTAKHSLIDSALIILLTLISIPIVFLEYRLATNFFQPIQIAQVAQFMIPSKSQYPVGVIFPIKIELMNIPAAINVAQADLSYDPKIVEVVDITTDGTFANFFVQKEFDNAKGYVRVTGGIPNPGYRQPTGLLSVVYLRGKAPGAVELKYLPSSLVLANDGRGSNLLADFPTIPIIITPIGAQASTAPSDLTIRNQIQGDKDKTVLTFTEYAHELPKPFDDTLGDSIAPTPAPTNNPSPIELQPVQPSNLILRFDHAVISYYQTLLNYLSR